MGIKNKNTATSTSHVSGYRRVVVNGVEVVNEHYDDSTGLPEDFNTDFQIGNGFGNDEPFYNDNGGIHISMNPQSGGLTTSVNLQSDGQAFSVNSGDISVSFSDNWQSNGITGSASGEVFDDTTYSASKPSFGGILQKIFKF